MSSPSLPGPNTYKQRFVRYHLTWIPQNVGIVKLDLHEGNTNEPIKQNKDESPSDKESDEVIAERKEYNLRTRVFYFAESKLDHWKSIQ